MNYENLNMQINIEKAQVQVSDSHLLWESVDNVTQSGLCVVSLSMIG